MIEKGTKVKLGTCGFHCWNPDKKEVEIGFDLLEQFNGKGYMHEAVERIIDFARHEMMVERINAIVYVENQKCMTLLERFGFVRLDEEMTEFKGQLYPHHIYALE